MSLILKTREELTDRYGCEHVAQQVLDISCETCGHPFARKGDMCPICEEYQREVEIPALAAALTDWFTEPRYHSFSHGFLDPGNRAHRRLLDP